MKKSIILFLLAVVPLLDNPLPQKSVDLERERAELLKIHAQDRQAHFKTDVDGLLSGLSPEGLIGVRQGKISHSPLAEIRNSFTAYFQNAAYHEWDDLEPPIVRISQDASMAWMITRTKVRRTQKDAAGAAREERFVYSGIMTYEKRDGKWLKVANVSTFE